MSSPTRDADWSAPFSPCSSLLRRSPSSAPLRRLPPHRRTTTATCNLLQQLLGQCRETTTTTTVASTSTTTARPTTTATTAPATSCGEYSTVAKAGGGVWSCAFSYEFNGTALDRSLWLAQTTKGSGFDLNDHGCFMDSPSNVS